MDNNSCLWGKELGKRKRTLKIILAPFEFFVHGHVLPIFISKVKLLYYFHPHFLFLLLFFISHSYELTLSLSLPSSTSSSTLSISGDSLQLWNALSLGFHNNTCNLDHTSNCFDTWFPKFLFFNLLPNLPVSFLTDFLFFYSGFHLWNIRLHSPPLF